MPRTLQKSFWLSKLLFVKEAFDPIRKGPPLWNFGISDELYFFQGNEITLRGKKCTALFQTHNWEKSSFFQCAGMRICTDIFKCVTGRAQCALPPGPNRVNTFNIYLLQWLFYSGNLQIKNLCRRHWILDICSHLAPALIQTLHREGEWKIFVSPNTLASLTVDGWESVGGMQAVFTEG